MAPSTRLRAHPERRINYAQSTIPRQPRKRPEHVKKLGEIEHKCVIRVKTGAVVKPEAEQRKLPGEFKSDKKTQDATQECLICAIQNHFNAPEDACEHFRATCEVCIAKLLEMKAAEHRLADVKLDCFQPQCNHSLDLDTLRTLVSEADFDAYDTAITKYALSANESYVDCSSISCGRAFSVEDCEGNKIDGQFVECPYCQFNMCMRCNRSWGAHRNGGCDVAKLAENKKSEAKIVKIGAKPCPKCVLNIQRDGGCKHMTCRNCRYEFCWDCLSEYLWRDACECQRAAVRAAEEKRTEYHGSMVHLGSGH